jgi:hypothetical protein
MTESQPLKRETLTQLEPDRVMSIGVDCRVPYPSCLLLYIDTDLVCSSSCIHSTRVTYNAIHKIPALNALLLLPRIGRKTRYSRCISRPPEILNIRQEMIR